MTESDSYNKHVNRELFVFGDESFRRTVAKIIDPLSFLQMTDHKFLKKPRQELHFLVADANFEDHASLQIIAKAFGEHDSANGYKIIYASKPEGPETHHLLFSAELGCRYTAYGKDKAKDLRAYLKRVALQAEQIGSVTHYENEISRMIKKADVKGLKLLDDRLGELGRITEDVLRLRAVINQRLSRLKRAEGFLKKILAINAQNLWAANELGKLYLITKRPSEGIAILEKLSRFHDINSERLLRLGDAYLNAGKTAQAKNVLEKGAALNKGQDVRFQEGLTKVKLLEGDEGVVSERKGEPLSIPIISFLNMRAILDIKTGRKEEGLKLYRIAINGCDADDLVKAKLNYNMGLGCIRSSKPKDALAYFEVSAKLGGHRFPKAQKTLEQTQKIIRSLEKKQVLEKIDGAEYEFEEFSELTTKAS